MIKAVKKDTGSFVYMKLKKHVCPTCGKQLKVVKMKKTVRSNTKEAANFDFTAANVKLGEKVKFIWFEFRCRDCNVQYTEDALRKIEKKAKEDAKEAKNAERKAAKEDAKEAKKAEKRAAKEAEKAEKRAAKEAACADEKTATNE